MSSGGGEVGVFVGKALFDHLGLALALGHHAGHHLGLQLLLGLLLDQLLGLLGCLDLGALGQRGRGQVGGRDGKPCRQGGAGGGFGQILGGARWGAGGQVVVVDPVAARSAEPDLSCSLVGDKVAARRKKWSVKADLP